MNVRHIAAFCAGTLSPLVFLVVAGSASAKSEIKGAAILDHPCGKTAVKQMGYVHAGNMDEANKLSTKEMQAQWAAMPAKDKTMMSGMMKEMSVTEAQYVADVKAGGLLVVDGPKATLTVQKKAKDGTSTTTQEFKVDGASCLVTR